MIFDIKGWTKIVAVHALNVPHHGHEHIIARATERSHADGVLIHVASRPTNPATCRPKRYSAPISGRFAWRIRTHCWLQWKPTRYPAPVKRFSTPYAARISVAPISSSAETTPRQ